MRDLFVRLFVFELVKYSKHLLLKLFSRPQVHSLPLRRVWNQKDVNKRINISIFMFVQIATSVAARGLDVKQLILVVNYDCPNHYEDYVHRCG